MAIVPCRECAHQVSDQAASCPSCGAPIASNVKIKPPARLRVSRILIALMALWTLGTLLWLIQPGWTRDELIARARSTLQSLDRNIDQLPRAEHSNATAQARSLQVNTVAAPPFPTAVPAQPAPMPRPVYRTTAEQLYRDYQANAVATQARIGASLVRLNGSVALIDQDATGHPVVKLWTGKDSAAAMTLTSDQRTAAAQLYKGEAVDIECDQIGGDTLLQGSNCTLAFVDIRTKEVNLALFLTNDSGAAHVYVVGPMSEAACRAQSEEISSRLKGKQRNEHLVWRSCTDAGRESILPGGCRLNAASVTLPSVPTAQLWRYDCGSTSEARTTSHERSTSGARPVLASTAAPDTEPETQPAPAPEPTAHVATNNLRFASAGGSDIGAPQASAKPDDLAQIRAMDPQAANHIAAYCSKAVAAPNQEAGVADCRRNEIAAWTRLVLQNEFPTLDEATRQKCSEPPFPDTYVAKESCARYEMHAN